MLPTAPFRRLLSIRATAFNSTRARTTLLRISRAMGDQVSHMSGGPPPPGREEPEKLSNVHVVLKTPLQPPFPPNSKTAVFATGCYWGTEKGFWRMPGVLSTSVGYAGGTTKNPTYEETCSGTTGHTEGVLVVYDPNKLAYSDLLRQFYESHDPSQKNRQGNDRGSQYRGAIYTFDEDQMKLARASAEAYAKALGRDLATEIRSMESAGPWYYAHEAYQQYLARPGSRPYCSAEPQGISLPAYDEWKPEGLLTDHTPKLPEEYWKLHAPKHGCHLGPPEQIKWPPA